VADAFTVKVDVGLGCDGNVFDFVGGHDEVLGEVFWPHEGRK